MPSWGHCDTDAKLSEFGLGVAARGAAVPSTYARCLNLACEKKNSKDRGLVVPNNCRRIAVLPSWTRGTDGQCYCFGKCQGASFLVISPKSRAYHALCRLVPRGSDCRHGPSSGLRNNILYTVCLRHGSWKRSMDLEPLGTKDCHPGLVRGQRACSHKRICKHAGTSRPALNARPSCWMDMAGT